MKRRILFHYAALLIVLSAVFSCEKNPVEPIPVPEVGTSVYKMTEVVSTYTGEQNGLGVFLFEFKGDNAELHLELFSKAVPEEDLLDANVVPGTYSVDSVAAEGVVAAGSSYLVRLSQDGTEEKLPVVGGSVYLVITDADQAAFITDLELSETEYAQCEYNGPIDIEPVYTTEFETYTGWYWGDSEYDFPDIGQYMVQFYLGETDGNGLVEGEGLSFDFYSIMAAEPWAAQIPEGTYLTSTEYAVNTVRVATEEVMENERWSIYAYANFQTIADGVDSIRFITDGKVKVERDGDIYVMKFNFLCEDGLRVLGKYTGPVVLGDEYTRTTLVEDVSMDNLGFGYVEYEGPSPMANIKGVNRWYIRLYDNTLKVDPDYYWGIYNDTYGEYIVMQVYTDGSHTDRIPEGRYVISEEEVPYHVNEGQGGFGFNFGTWYYYFEDGENLQQAPAISGEVNIAWAGEDYIIDAVIIDDRGNEITASYEGPLTYWDSYGDMSAAVPQWVWSPRTQYEAGKSIRICSDLVRHYGGGVLSPR